MTIHHATAKKAETNGITLTEEEGNVQAKFEVGTKTLELTFPDDQSPKDILEDVMAFKILAVEHGLLAASTEDLDGFFVYQKAKDGTLAIGPVEESVLDAAHSFLEGNRAEEDFEHGLDADEDEEVEDEEVEGGGSVVKPKYREVYRQNWSKGVNNGDDLARLLQEYLHNEDGVVDIAKIDHLAEQNGIDYMRYHKDTPGWQGRYRMTIGNILRARVKRKEEVFIPGWPPVSEEAPVEQTPDQPETETEGGE